MKVAILGSSGFVGKNLMLSLQKDWEVTAFFNSSSNFPQWAEKNNIRENTIFIQQDLSREFNFSYPDKVEKHFDLVISLIGDTRKLDKSCSPIQNFNSDPLALIGFFNRFTCDKFLYFSSGCVYEGHTGIVSAQDTVDIKPFTAYAIAKRTSEMLLDYFLREGKIKQYLAVRFFGAYGPHQRDEKISSKFVKTFCVDQQNSITLFGNGKNLIDAMYIQDTIDWILLAVQQKFMNNTIDFGLAAPITIKELTIRIAKVCGIDNPIIKWDVKSSPKEDYHFMLGDKWFVPETPFQYKFKVNLEDGIEKLKQWLVSRGK